MSKENKLEYERVDEKGDEYRRILVKFNPRFLRGSDFEIEFIPHKYSTVLGKIFVTEIDSMSSIDLYRWACRRTCMKGGLKNFERGTILSKKTNMEFAKIFLDRWRAGEVELEPRQIISRVKRVFESIAKEFSDATAFSFNHFLYSGQLGSLPLVSKEFNMEKLRKMIEEYSYDDKNANGEVVERSLIEHLFDTHKTEYVEGVILNYLKVTYIAARMLMESKKKEQ